MSNNITFLLDMDGVCVDFVSGVAEVFNIEPENLYDKLEDQWDVAEAMNISTDKLWNEIDKEGKDFWADLNKYPWFKTLWEFIHAHGEVYICTTPSLSPDSPEGKVMWMQQHLGKHYRNFVLTPYKHLLADENTILIDDSIKNVDKFRNHGGKAIIFPQPWNKTYTKEELGYYPDYPLDAVISGIADYFANSKIQDQTQKQ